MPDQWRRPHQSSPPKLVLEPARPTTGKLRIFFGVAPGVGKTYEMLLQAHAKKQDGHDVVVGFVKMHGRKDTEALLSGLEIIPRRRIDYKGRTAEETDLGGIIARRPQIVLVDELAQSNAPGSRHPSCHLDIEALLIRGINVYTTVNIAHIRSLRDAVAKIIRFRQRNTVPDILFDRADVVEFIDLPPDQLIQRFKEGKVAPKRVERMLEQFSPANLVALRELALQRLAKRADARSASHTGTIPKSGATRMRIAGWRQRLSNLTLSTPKTRTDSRR